MRGTVKPARPGIASANRPRSGSFAGLLDQILHDESALDGLAFAYAELPAPERRALAHAVLQDAGDPTHALIAFLAVEDNPSLRQRLTGLIGQHGRIVRSAWLDGTEAQGEACLMQSIPGLEHESLLVAWKGSKIQHIEIKSRSNTEVDATAPAVPLAEAVEILAPLVWRHIRSGRSLPDGVERFGGFFSVG